uniref:Uncharacterized protein n=1 Tax=Aegilops tauschii subsp. strangulata TaxID=200361 RepID=A0A453DJK4_AEGTS
MKYETRSLYAPMFGWRRRAEGSGKAAPSGLAGEGSAKGEPRGRDLRSSHPRASGRMGRRSSLTAAASLLAAVACQGTDCWEGRKKRRD